MIEVPASFRAMPRWWGEGQAWLDSLPGLVQRHCRQWGLTPDGAVRHGSNALVLPVRRGPDRLVLRLAPPADAADDARPLRFWAGRGTVLLVEDDLDAGALLLERLDADRSLATEPLDLAAEQLGLIMRRLAVPAPPTVVSTTDLIADRVVAMRPVWVDLGRPVPETLLAQAVEAGHALTTVDASCAANGDLHHAQVLAGVREPWLCVDLRLLRGDPCYDLARCLLTRLDEMADDAGINAQLTIMADAAGVDLDHARRSALYRTVDYWLWGLGYGLTEDPVRCARLASALSA